MNNIEEPDLAQESVTPPAEAADRQLLQRDGASQAGRAQAALDPDYVVVDERSFKDWLAFAREYAKELHYFDVEDNQVQALGDWSGFLSSELDLAELVAFMQEPERFLPEQVRAYTRPHLVLFLTFLHLLRQTQAHLNTLTRRHLDFYYQQVLGLTKRPATPDQVNVLIDLAPETGQFQLSAGTLLNAGTDSLGQDLFYRTDRDIVANHAQVARLSSVYAEKRIIGIREARERHTGPKIEAFMRMLQIALGQPFPGDPLPPYKTGETVTYEFLLALQKLVDFVHTGLFMEFSEFRTLMQLKHRRDRSEAEWQEINQLLEKAGRQRSGDPNFQLNPANPQDFEANLEVALGGPPNFDGLTEVKDIYDLYDQRIRESVQQFIRDNLYFADINDFVRMMQIKVRIDNEWAEINRILEAAGQRKGRLEPTRTPYIFPVKEPKEAGAFEANLEAALGPDLYAPLAGLDNLDDYEAALLRVEAFFFMPAESFAYLMAVTEKADATPPEWGRVYDLLAEAYKVKVYADRQDRLKQIREAQGFDAMIDFAAGDDQQQTGLTALEQLKEYIRKAEDAAFLDQIKRREATGDVTATEWEAVYRIVELAQRVRLGEPVAQKEEWLNLYPAEDATAIRVDTGFETETSSPRWQTFGQGQPAVRSGSPPPATFGWAISSPVLALSQGRRAISLTLGFGSDQFHFDTIRRLFPDSSDSAADDDGPFRIEISTEKGWIQADTAKVTVGDYPALSGLTGDEVEPLPALRFELTFAENVDALAPLLVEADQPDTPWPTLRLMLRQIWQPRNGQPEIGRYISYYQPFKALILLRTHIKVAVSGLTPEWAQNDETVLAPHKPFEPFGVNAVAGSRFYLGHPELVDKRLDSLHFQLEWLGVPDNLEVHYRNYPGLTITSTKNFTAKISLIDRRLELPLLQAAPLFAGPEASQPQTISLADVPAAVAAGRPGYAYDRAPAATLGQEMLAWPRYLQWELNTPDFQQAAYPTVVAQKSLALATAMANKQADETIKAEDYQVNPPYTPKIKKLSLDYTSSAEIITKVYRPGSQIDRIFHIHPFGYHEIQPESDNQHYLFLPQYDHEGELYLGIRDAQPPQNLSLLFQMAEGSANPDLERLPVQWSYLSDNRWLSLDDGNMLLDTTRGLINSGIIVFALEPARPSTLLPPSLYWLRAAMPQHSSTICDTVAIHAQAVSATLASRDHAPDHLSRPLPAGSITELAEPLPQVAAIRQPYTSYGGKMGEQDRTFYTRSSERLRHKHRALTVWDYEHMILERFSQIYKAKCLPADSAHPGQVELIVIPDIRNKLPFNPFEPKAPSDLIADIEAYLVDNIPAFATIKVKNAHYVPVKVRFAVRFRPGYNEGYYRQRLNEELNRFLSPWAYEEGAEIVIGGRIYANVIINFIEERPYVDYVAEVKLFSSEDGRTFKLVMPSANGYWVETDRPDGVLVAARQHEIDMIPDTGYEEEAFTGLNYMKIELDFVVG
jgi:hypothetical protein